MNDDFSKIAQKPIDMFPHTDTLKNGPQTSIPSTQAMLSAWY
ncbi:hypothetical protein [Thermoanaerobacterium aotearoense]|nr:hypothetical protein [Thermoanaerobacterium aotearoense]